MSLTLTILLVVQVLSALAIIVLVLLQQGKGADMGSAFGSGSAGSLFGASGAANFLSRSTKWAAVIFFVSTLGLAYLSHGGSSSGGAMESGVMQDFPADRSVPQVPGAAGNGNSSVPQTAPAQPDASVPQAPAPAAPQSESKPADVPAAPAPAEQPSAEKPAEQPAQPAAPAQPENTPKPAQ
ncbi:preprotein translocase subunit SecG [Bordetella petrii]|uniref:Protein-export membrane protein SecG n=1 Tax=Bordetella petrii TaxID=94624 RepID=A0ABT7W3M2_9BORD|nr:preprotein translocase subunit SecG [Bordetella petrii]MDM9559757.1 preprotein translocase subunit SecG [Bordetella petrii]